MRPTHRNRRGLILPVALLVLGLLSVLAAKVVVRSNADLAAAIQEARSQRRTAILVQVVRRGIRPAFIPLLLAE